MKKLYSVGKVVFGLVLALSLASCSTPGMKVTTFSDVSDDGPHFVDEGSVNAVLQFSSWDYTFLLRPQYAQDGYLQQVRRDNVGKVFDKLNVRRGTAVVVVGWTYNGEVLHQVVSDWKTILGGCGFQRVVVLRAQLGNKLNGSVIVDDSTLHVGSLQSASRGG